jgi:dihydrodipicolinate synthase/N-acetylneuraminate lyase
MRMQPCMLTTVCLPLDEKYCLMEDMFRDLIRHSISRGFNNLYLFGTAGEGYALTDGMFKRSAEIFFEEMRQGGGICQLGIIALSTPQVRERIETGLEIGYRSFQISLPSWGKLNDSETYAFFDETLGSYPQAHFLHYNIIRGLRKLTGREYARIAADHPNLVATKCGAKSMMEDMDLITNAPDLCHFMTELDYAYTSQFGPCGLLAGYSTLSFDKAHRYFEAGRNRDLPELVAMSLEMYKVLMVIVEGMTQGQHMDGAYDKMFHKALIPDFPLRLLPPYQGTSDEEFYAIVERLRREFPGWVE